MRAAEDATSHLRAVAERLGLPLRQFVALMGAHKLGRWWRDVQPPYFHQFYAPGPLKFDNVYFKCAAPKYTRPFSGAVDAMHLLVQSKLVCRSKVGS